MSQKEMAEKENAIEMARLRASTNPDINAQDDQGLSLLHKAVDEGNLQAIAQLVKHDVDVDGRNFAGETALHRAINCFDKNKVVYTAIIQMLLAAHINANIQDNNGNTALHLAASGGYEDIVEMLLKAGA